MFAKLIDGNLKRYKPPIRTGSEDIYTNDAELLLSYGWKEVVFVDAPEKEGYFPVAEYKETATRIVQEWTLRQILEYEEQNDE